MNYINGTVRNIHYGDIHTKFRTLFDLQSEYVPFINPEVNITRIADDNYCIEGDIVFADASEDLNDVGKSIEIVNLGGEKLLAGLHTLLARPKANTFSKGFVGYLLQSKKVRTQIQKEAQGTKVLSISASRISNVKLTFPSIHEQDKIKQLLQLIDERISKSSKLIQKYETLIENIRAKVFSQQLRFKESDDRNFPNWEYRKLNEICFEHKKKNYKNGVVEVFSVAKQKGVINQIEHLGRSYSAKEISHYKLIEQGDLVYTKSPTSNFPFGIVKQNRTGRVGVVSPLYCVFSPKNDAIGYLIHEYFQSPINTYNYLNPIVQKGAKNTMNINNDEFLGGKSLCFPSSEKEQEIITRFLISIDKKIDLEKNFLTQLEKQKKYLLQNLFV